MGGGADGARRRDLHAGEGHRRPHAVQSGDRRNGEGTPGPRDRRARRADGARDRRDRAAVQAAEPQPRALPSGRRARRPTSGDIRRGCARRSKRQPNISWILGKAGRILVEGGRVTGIAMEDGDIYACDALIVTTGTFLNGLVHVGRDRRPAGRADEPPSTDLAGSLKSFGFSWGRLKTGTPPRLHRRSIDFTRFRRGSWRRSAGPVFVPDAGGSRVRRSRVTSSTRRTACMRWCASTSRNRRCSTARSPESDRATVRRSKTR